MILVPPTYNIKYKFLLNTIYYNFQYEGNIIIIGYYFTLFIVMHIKHKTYIKFILE